MRFKHGTLCHSSTLATTLDLLNTYTNLEHLTELTNQICKFQFQLKVLLRVIKKIFVVHECENATKGGKHNFRHLFKKIAMLVIFLN